MQDLRPEVTVRMEEALQFLRVLVKGTWTLNGSRIMWMPPDGQLGGKSLWSPMAVIEGSTLMAFHGGSYALWYDCVKGAWSRAPTLYDALERFVERLPSQHLNRGLEELYAWTLEMAHARQPVDND